MAKFAGGSPSASASGPVAVLLPFYLIALSFSWVCWAPLVLSRTGVGWLPFSVGMPWVIPGTAGPLIAALVMSGRERRAWARSLLRARWLQAALGCILGVIVLAVTFVLGSALLMTVNPPRGWDLAALNLYGFHVFATFAAGPVFEEWGWRGFAQAHLQQRISPAAAAVVVGLGQGFWHLPLFLIPTWSSSGVISYVAMVVALSVVIAWGFNLSGQNILVVIVLHATFNASSRVLGGFLGDAQLRRWPDGVTAILISFCTVAFVLVILTRGRLGLPRSQGAESD